jgi:hypothetical protein
MKNLISCPRCQGRGFLESTGDDPRLPVERDECTDCRAQGRVTHFVARLSEMAAECGLPSIPWESTLLDFAEQVERRRTYNAGLDRLRQALVLE